ncbi:hypothetical protein FA95DRAFT_1606635 [Auriscalpium vulgare]|uniref:Uncharacterized protein n=1 Tax=Auriscalpium vulgare TaxID=40419 RepID=A0ACB8RT28_9AGAM|nr:hypothetical protein FA95DRAFT_1606635 [Auriscalpium vulgare]
MPRQPRTRKTAAPQPADPLLTGVIAPTPTAATPGAATLPAAGTANDTPSAPPAPATAPATKQNGKRAPRKTATIPKTATAPAAAATPTAPALTAQTLPPESVNAPTTRTTAATFATAARKATTAPAGPPQARRAQQPVATAPPPRSLTPVEETPEPLGELPPLAVLEQPVETTDSTPPAEALVAPAPAPTAKPTATLRLGKHARSPSPEETPRARTRARTRRDNSPQANEQEGDENIPPLASHENDDGSTYSPSLSLSPVFTSDLASTNRFGPLFHAHDDYHAAEPVDEASFGALVDEDYSDGTFGPVTHTPASRHTSLAPDSPLFAVTADRADTPFPEEPQDGPAPPQALNVGNFFTTPRPGEGEDDEDTPLTDAQLEMQERLLRDVAQTAALFPSADLPSKRALTDPLERARGRFPDVLHASPAVVWMGLKPSQVTSWASIIEPCVMILTFDTRAHLPENILTTVNSIKRVVKRHGNAHDPHVFPPAPSPTATRTGRYPKTFMLTNITKETAVTMLAIGIFSTRLITFQALPRQARIPKLVALIEGIIDTATVDDVRAIIFHTWSKPDFLDFLRNLTEKTKRNPNPCSPQQFIPFLESITITKLPLLSRGNVPAPRFVVTSPKASLLDVDQWLRITQHIATLSYESDLFGVGRVTTPYPCPLCNGTDHPRGLCPFPLHPGWNGGGRDTPPQERRPQQPFRNRRAPEPTLDSRAPDDPPSHRAPRR